MTERCRLCALDFEPDDDTTPGPPICGLCAGTVLGAVRLDIRPNRLLPGGALAGLFNQSAVAAIGRLEAERDQARAEVQRVVEASTAKIAALEQARDILARQRTDAHDREAEAESALVLTASKLDKARGDHNLLWTRLAAALGFDAPIEGIDLRRRGSSWSAADEATVPLIPAGSIAYRVTFSRMVKP